MKSALWTSCCVALLIGGCPKRQRGPRLVYVAAPPPATSAAPDSGTLVIEEPASAEEPETDTPVDKPAPPTPQPKPRPRNPRRASPSAEPAATEPTTNEPSSVAVPPLEPANGAGGAGLRQSIETTQQDVSLRLAQFERSPLSDAERRTLAEAKAFLDQSTRALNEGDLQRADKLVHKAYLLITAFEQRH